MTYSGSIANGSVSLETVRGPRRIKLRGGYYDFSRKAELEDELDAAQPQSVVVLDLVATTALECACIGIIIGKLREWRRVIPDAEIRLRNVSACIARSLRLLELESVLVIESEKPQP